MRYGFVKVATAVPAVKVADVEYNVQQIESLIAQAGADGDGIVALQFFRHGVEEIVVFFA